MNLTQELITTSYTLGHAVQTIEDLKDNTSYQIKLFKKEKHTDSETFKKLEKLHIELEKLSIEAKKTNKFL